MLHQCVHMATAKKLGSEDLPTAKVGDHIMLYLGWQEPTLTTEDALYIMCDKYLVVNT